jgi:hypothetical protein
MSDEHRHEEQLGAAIQAAVADIHAPDRLRADVDALRAGPRPAPRRRGLPVFGVAGAALVAAAAVVLVLVLGPGDDGSPVRQRPADPTLEQVTLAAMRPAVNVAPREDRDEPALVEARINGLQFPYWQDDFGLDAVGTRRERLGGREAMTVTYRGGSQEIGYTIIAGAPLPYPRTAREAYRGHTELYFLRDGTANVVAWRRAGHTCVLASRDASVKKLLRLAAWTGAGGVGGYAR